MPAMKVHQAVARALHDNGVEIMFGLMGDANMFMANSFVRDCGGQLISAGHEAGAACMALGYALLTGRPGVCSVTHGPALTNTVTALVEGVKASVPLVLLCGDTDTLDRQHTQNVGQRAFIEVTGAAFIQLRSPSTVVEDVTAALRQAVAERRPVALNLPYEFDWAETDYEPRRLRVPERRGHAMESADLDDAIGIIAAARRPLILAGRGAARPCSRETLLKLARRIGAPVATTLKGKDLFSGEPENIGIFGTVSSAGAVDVIIESDCVIAFGASLNRYTTSHGAFLKGKRVIQVNQEPTEIGKNAAPDVGIVGDVTATVETILHWLDAAEIPSSEFCDSGLIARLAENGPARISGKANREGTVDFRDALARIDALLPRERILVTDGGRFMAATWGLVEAPDPQSFITTVDFGSIGLGLGHAIGAAAADPSRPVTLITGDGGFMHGGLSEFNTAVRHKQDLIVVVCNDGAYGAEHIKFHHRDMDPRLICFDWPDLASVARSLGGEGVTVSSQEHWAAVEQAITVRNGPLLIDIKIDPDCISA